MASVSEGLLSVGKFTGNLASVYHQYLALLPAKDEKKLAKLFIDFVSEVGIDSKQTANKLTQSVLRYSTKDAISWNEFCVLVAEASLSEGAESPSQPTNQCTATVTSYSNMDTNPNSSVFLGGSCNPTVWRRECSIPLLEKAGIKFYNPQVDEWSPQLMNIEEEAKQDASVLLFVVDAQTRAISSMVEIALLIGSGRRLVLVVTDINEDQPAAICGERLADTEVKGLNCGRELVRELALVHCVMVEETVAAGTDTMIDIMKKRISPEEIASKCSTSRNCSDKVKRVIEETQKQLRIIRQLLELFKSNSSFYSEVLPPSLSLAKDLPQPLPSSLASVLLSCCDHNPDHTHTPNTSASLLVGNFDSLPPTSSTFSDHTHLSSGNSSKESCSIKSPARIDHTHIDHAHICSALSSSAFNTFCVCYSEIRYRMSLANGFDWSKLLSTLLVSPVQWMKEWVCPELATPTRTTNYQWDVFLGGSSGDAQWREAIVIPLLKKNNVTYFNPRGMEGDVPLVFQLLHTISDSRCSVLLFIVTGDTLSVQSLIEAAYYIGLGKRVVLCVQDILVGETGFVTVEGIKFNKASIKDYNRGRAYLRSLAIKRRVPVYSSIHDAVTCCIHQLQGGERGGKDCYSSPPRRGIKRSLSNSSLS